MLALSLGLLAALAWGIHDICVRFVTQNTNLYTALFVVLVSGSTFQFLYLSANGSSIAIASPAISMVIFSGAAFIVASIGLYKAFEIGPIRLVAPIIASYPIVTIAIAFFGGRPITAFQLLAVVLIIAGVSIVAALSDTTEVTNTPVGQKISPKSRAIFWAVISAIGFSASFAFGHAATAHAAELPVTLLSRLVAIVILLTLLIGLKISPVAGLAQLPILIVMGLMDAIAHASVISAGRMENAEYAAVAASTFGMVTILLAWFFLKEPVGRLQWIGVLMVFGGIGYLAGF